MLQAFFWRNGVNTEKFPTRISVFRPRLETEIDQHKANVTTGTKFSVEILVIQ
jgi:hypothetical protein